MKSRIYLTPYVLSFLTSLISTAFAASAPIFGRGGLLSRQVSETETDFEDLSFIRSWASIGDSYAAGIGAGKRIDRACSRYDLSYPYFISLDERLGTAPFGRVWQNLACSGAKTTDVIEKQIPALDNGQQMITLSIGGNDVGLTKILNDCIFGWLPFFISCDTTIENTRKNIQDELPGKLDEVIKVTRSKLAGLNTHIYFTGYAQFFNENTTQCNDISFKFWTRISGFLLDRNLRARLNELVRLTNAQIEAAIDRSNKGDIYEPVVYVGIDTYFSQYGGLYCETDITEPDPNRQDLIFYESDTTREIMKRKRRQDFQDDNIFPNSTFEGEIANWIEDTLERYPEWIDDVDGEFQKLDGPSYRTLVAEIDGEGLTPRQAGLIGWIIDDKTRRVFHPQPNGHAVIANIIITHMVRQNMKGRGIPLEESEEQTIDTCPRKCANPSGCPTCSDNSASHVPALLRDPSDGQIIELHELLFKLRQASCTNACELIQDLPGAVQVVFQNEDKSNCEISVALPNNVEAWAYRGTPSTGSQWQDCWDAFANITNWCVRKGPNNGWVNGPAPYEYFQTGFRPINAETALHEPLNPEFSLLDADS